MVKVAVYARVSTKKQGERDTIDNQLREIKEYVLKEGYSLYKEYVDNGYSGATEDRPQLNQLMKDSHERRFDAVIVWKFDRFARSTKHLISTLEEFKSLGIDFVSLKENIDTTKPWGKFTFTIFAAMAEFERDIIRERIISGMNRSREQGQIFGRKPKFNDIVIVYDMRERGLSVRQIGENVGISRTRVSQLLKEKDDILNLVKCGKTVIEIARELKIRRDRAEKIIEHLHNKMLLNVHCPLNTNIMAHGLS